VAVARCGKTDEAEARIVDHVLDLGALRGERLGEPAGDASLRKIGLDHERTWPAGCSDLVGEIVEPVFAARHQREVMAVPRELARQRDADARRRAGDEGDGTKIAHALLDISPLVPA